MGKTPAGIMIRSLTAADLTAVSSIDEKSFFDVWSPSMWLVAGEAQITRVAVAAEEREHGLGTRLTAALINKAWELGAVAVTLEVRESNIAAQKVYLTCGFASEGIRPNYYEDNHENAIIMWLYKEGKPDV